MKLYNEIYKKESVDYLYIDIALYNLFFAIFSPHLFYSYHTQFIIVTIECRRL